MPYGCIKDTSKRETGRQTDRQTETVTERHRHTETETERLRDRDRDRETERERDRVRQRQRQRETDTERQRFVRVSMFCRRHVICTGSPHVSISYRFLHRVTTGQQGHKAGISYRLYCPADVMSHA